MIKLEIEEYLNETQRFKESNYQSFFETNSYSFGVDSNKKIIKNEDNHTGCHSFVKDRLYGKDKSLCVVLHNPKRCFYQKEEITEYIDLLKKIGFQIEFEGLLTNDKVKNTYGNILYYSSKENYVFLLGENYKNNAAICRYMALCLLRTLWSRNQFWLPYRFLEFYDYFKKKKIKPSLSKILVFANLCPHNIFNEEFLRIKYGNISDISEVIWNNYKDRINLESILLTGYYGFIGHSNADVVLNFDYDYIHNSFFISLLLTAETNFNLVDFIENYDNLSKVERKTPLSYYSLINYVGKTRQIWDSSQKLNVTLKNLLKEKKYHKAFLFLKEIATVFKKYPDNHFTNLTKEDMKNIDSTKTHIKKEESEEFIKEVLEKLDNKKLK